MSLITPTHWMSEQFRQGRSLCLVLDAEADQDGVSRQALTGKRGRGEYRSVYGETEWAQLSAAGPFVFLLNDFSEPALHDLLACPEDNWGWLFSLASDELSGWLAHWRERLLIGQRPDQALYRFHDNRVLARALEHLPVELHPAYLGPACSVCYWAGERWVAVDNPQPGEYRVPAEPGWLALPSVESRELAILHANLSRYLLAEQPLAMARLALKQTPSQWLMEQLIQARQWGWRDPEQVHFLIIQRLEELDGPVVKSWLPREGESPQRHFQRIGDEVRFGFGRGAK